MVWEAGDSVSGPGCPQACHACRDELGAADCTFLSPPHAADVGVEDFICNWVSGPVVAVGQSPGRAGMSEGLLVPGPQALPSLPQPAHELLAALPTLRLQVGNRQWVDVLPWDGSQRWAAAVEETWVVDGEEVRLWEGCEACFSHGAGEARVHPPHTGWIAPHRNSTAAAVGGLLRPCCAAHSLAALAAWPDACLQAGTVTAVDGFSFVKVARAGHMVSAHVNGPLLYRRSCACLLGWFAAPGGGGAVPCRVPLQCPAPPSLPGLIPRLPLSPSLAVLVTNHTLPSLSPACPQVPMDQPKNGLDMITRFTRGEPLATAGPVAGSHSYMRRPPADQSSARLLPGAMWQLRRAMPDRQASLSASEE